MGLLINPYTFATAGGGPGGGGYFDEVMPDSPVAYWRLGDRALGTAADSSGNSGALTYRASSANATSLLASGEDAATDAGTDGIATGPASAALQAVSGEFSLEAFVRLDGGGAGNIIEHTNSSVAHFYLIADRPNNRWTFGWNDGSWRDHFFGYSFTTGATVHVCAVAEATTCRLYINGSELSNQGRNGGAIAWGGADSLGLGCSPRAATGGVYLDGVLDEVAVYDTALSAARVAAHYAAAS